MIDRFILLPLVVAFFLMHGTHAHSQPAECDYSSAAEYDGWGFNVVTGESCEPLVCETTQRDPDGDGFGLQDGQICTVTDESVAAPSLTNRETGLTVVFTPTYWDANKDIANRTIQCDSYYFDEGAGTYVVEDEDYRDEWGDLVYASHTYFHHPVSPVEPFVGWIDTIPSNAPPVWSIENGVYNGLAALSSFSSSYLEVVSPPDAGKRVRVWVSAGQSIGPSTRWFDSRVRHDGYVECRDISGADFEPTGAPGVATSVNHKLQDIRFAPEITGATKPTITNAATGVQVDLISPVWNYNNDVANRRVECSRFWHGNGEFHNALTGKQWHLPVLFEDSPATMNYHGFLFPDGISSSGEWSFGSGIPAQTNGSSILSSIFAAEYLEVAERGVRSWAEDGEGYTQCTLFPSETAASLQQDSSAPPLQDESAASPLQDACDYTNAAMYGGWGWNSATRTSCPPLEGGSQSDNAIVEGADALDIGADSEGDAPADNSAPDTSNNAVIDNGVSVANSDLGGDSTSIDESTGGSSVVSSSGGGSMGGGMSLLCFTVLLAFRRKTRQVLP